MNTYLNTNFKTHLNNNYQSEKCLYLFENLWLYCAHNNTEPDIQYCKQVLNRTFECDRYENLSKYRQKTSQSHTNDLSTFPDKETLRTGIKSSAQASFYKM